MVGRVDFAQFDQFVDYGIDRKSGRAVDLELARDVAAVRDDRMQR